MIKQLILKNFRGWKSQTFDLSEGVNIFCGPSDKGKSAAALEPIEWVRTNRPLGFEFASDWIKEKNKKGEDVLIGICEVKIVFSDGIWISRAIGKDVNEYRISIYKDPLTAFNKAVPEEVEKIFNMSDLNIQLQEDPYFLFNLSPPEIGRKLNQIASLSDIDKAFKNADSAIRQINSDIKYNNQSIKESVEKLKGFDWLDQAEIDLKETEKISEKLTRVRNQECKFRNLFERWQKIDEDLEKIKWIDKAEKEINDLNNLQIEIEEKEEIFNLLQDKENKLKDIENIIENTKWVQEAEEEIKNLFILHNEIIKMQSENDRLIKYEEGLIDLDIVINQLNDQINEAEKEYKESFPDICPLCERKM